MKNFFAIHYFYDKQQKIFSQFLVNNKKVKCIMKNFLILMCLLFLNINVFGYDSCYAKNIYTQSHIYNDSREQKENNFGMIFGIIALLSVFFNNMFSKEDKNYEDNSSKNNYVSYSRPRKTIDTWLQLKDKVIEIYGNRCVKCGATDNIDVHHKIPLKEGGTNCIENLIPLCRHCHEELHGYKMSNYDNHTKIDDYYGSKISKYSKSKIGYIICNAIKNKYRIKIKYKSGKASREKITERIIKPIEITLGCECSNSLVKNSSYDKYKKFLRAYCELRQEERLFRLDRIMDILEIYK